MDANSKTSSRSGPVESPPSPLVRPPPPSLPGRRIAHLADDTFSWGGAPITAITDVEVNLFGLGNGSFACGVSYRTNPTGAAVATMPNYPGGAGWFEIVLRGAAGNELARISHDPLVIACGDRGVNKLSDRQFPWAGTVDDFATAQWVYFSWWTLC